MKVALPSPEWALVTTDGDITTPWYQYMKSADVAWRPNYVEVTSVDIAASTLNLLIPNYGWTYINTSPNSTSWTLSAPEPGVRKIITMADPTTTGLIYTASPTNLIAGFGQVGIKIAFPTSYSWKTIELIGQDNGNYQVISNPSSCIITT